MQCDALTFGSIVRGFGPLGLWPGPADPSELFMSVLELTATLREISIGTYPANIAGYMDSLKQRMNGHPSASTLTTSMAFVRKLVDSFYANPHRGCNFKEKLSNDIKKIMDNIPSAVLDSHLRHMENQSKK